MTEKEQKGIEVKREKITISEYQFDTLFKRVMMFTDIHFGKFNNAQQHLDDCERFISWIIEQKNDFDAIYFLGDWFENRGSISILTLDYANRCINRLSELGKPIFISVGNHDLNILS